MTRRCLLLLALLLCAPAARAGEERVVALGGAVTEILYALGARDRIVAVDTTRRQLSTAFSTASRK